jgi:hypothetical protein
MFKKAVSISKKQGITNVKVSSLMVSRELTAVYLGPDLSLDEPGDPTARVSVTYLFYLKTDGEPPSET